MKAIFITEDKRIIIRDADEPKLVFVRDGNIFIKDGVPSEEAVEEWRTINGAAVPIGGNGQVLGGAGGKFTGQKFGQQNTSKQNHSFRYNYTINKAKQMRDKGHSIPAGAKVTGVKPIAKGTQVKQASNLTKRYKVSDPTKWQKVRCRVDVNFPDGTKQNREVHYYYHPQVGEVEYKFPSNKNQK